MTHLLQIEPPIAEAPENPVDNATYAPQITGKNLEKETVTIENAGATDVNMTNHEGDQAYMFPVGYVLKSGSSVNIKSGPNADHSTPNNLKWTDAYMWNNSDDTAKFIVLTGIAISELP